MSADLPTRISATRRVAAPASTIYAIVSDPAGHVAIDGSGMLQLAPDARPLQAVGDVFTMDMDREPLGDNPAMGKYQVRNTVTRIEPDRLVEWNVAFKQSVGHVYGWQLDPVNDTETDVTNYCDWSAVAPEIIARRPWPIVPLDMLEQSVVKLERLATKAGS